MHEHDPGARDLRQLDGLGDDFSAPGRKINRHKDRFHGSKQVHFGVRDNYAQMRRSAAHSLSHLAQ
jgi:hypothetical protein